MPCVVARRCATALIQARSQHPATGMFRHPVQIATLPGLTAWWLTSGNATKSAFDRLVSRVMMERDLHNDRNTLLHHSAYLVR